MNKKFRELVYVLGLNGVLLVVFTLTFYMIKYELFLGIVSTVVICALYALLMKTINVRLYAYLERKHGLL